ncbi:MAG: hypothetical protein JWO31_3445 [Phycisphaerales bacterium]|nr:hypothetical protein [Phycisphaerales bacterium]
MIRRHVMPKTSPKSTAKPASPPKPAPPSGPAKPRAKAPPAAPVPAGPPLDALVLGGHPAAYLAATLLHVGDGKAKPLRVVHACIPGEHDPDRLVLVNPAVFGLHPLLEPVRKRLDLTPVYGVQFVSDDPAVRSEHRAKAAVVYAASTKALRAEFARMAEQAGVETTASPKRLEVQGVDEHGLHVTLNRQTLRPRALVLGGRLPDDQQKRLGVPDAWGPEVVFRYTFVRLTGKRWADLGPKPVAPMSLNLRETLCWGWLLPGPAYNQIAVAQPVETVGKLPPADLLAHWARVLHGAGNLPRADLPTPEAESLDLPLAGALAHEGVANRTLLVGPAGGFYCASGEDLYPNCWSAVFAAAALKKALKETHLQDALNPYRSQWRTTLGQYLRGPQQDLRFLLPLIYRNAVMTSRLAESILLGKSVVR